MGFSGLTSLDDFLSALASAEDAHGAVAAAAYAGAMGASLLLMVAALPKTRSDSAEDRAALMRCASALRDVPQQLMETIETETAVKVFTARAMPSGSQAQRTEREAAIQIALRAAADVPLEVMRLSVAALRQAEIIASRGCHAASGDVQLAVAFLRDAADGARANLESKLSSLTDVLYTASVVDEISRLSEEATAAAHTVVTLIQPPPA
jgi:formiminotetrahydrofolate cyclodeaminase